VFADQPHVHGLPLRNPFGISFGIDDIVIRSKKTKIVAAADHEVKEIQNQYSSGLVTNGERYNKVVDIWSRANDQGGEGHDGEAGLPRRPPIRGGQLKKQKFLQLDLHDG